MSKTKQIYITPKELEEYFERYKEWVAANPILVQDYVGKDGKEVDRKRQRPLTIDGFEIWLRHNAKIKSCQHILDNVNSVYGDFIEVARYIKSAIKNDQVEGGMVGIYSHSITARLNGLTEKIQEDGSKEVTIKVKYERKGNNPE